MTTATTPIIPTSRTYRVLGMTCGHCVAAVEREVGAIAGVTDVFVELSTGNVLVTSTGPVDHHAMAAAIDEAGYELGS